LTIGEGGALYGATPSGGVYGYGTVFSLTPPAPPGGSWTFSLVYTFQSDNPEWPATRLTIGPGGVLYGETLSNYGPIYMETYSLTPPASAGDQWSFAIIASFSVLTPIPGGVAISPGGVLYGEAGQDPGFVFALIPPASRGGAWTQHTVKKSNIPFVNPAGGLAIGAGGVLYGTLLGAATTPAEIFELAPPATPGGAWTETVLYQFTGTGSGLATEVVIGGGGVLYGTLSEGGSI